MHMRWEGTGPGLQCAAWGHVGASSLCLLLAATQRGFLLVCTHCVAVLRGQRGLTSSELCEELTGARAASSHFIASSPQVVDDIPSYSEDSETREVKGFPGPGGKLGSVPLHCPPPGGHRGISCPRVLFCADLGSALTPAVAYAHTL